MYSHYYSYPSAPPYMQYIPTQYPQHSAHPCYDPYAAQQDAQPSFHPSPHYGSSQVYQPYNPTASYDQSHDHLDGPQDGASEGSVDDPDDDYVPGGTSRPRQGVRKRGGKKKRSASSRGARPPVLGMVQPNIPESSHSFEADGVPPEIQRRLKNFSGTLLAYPPGSSLDINNLLIITPAPTDGEGDDEYEKYTCRVCSKTYAGKNARSVARRHLQDKHNVPLSTQPRRSRWEKGASVWFGAESRAEPAKDARRGEGEKLGRKEDLGKVSSIDAAPLEEDEALDRTPVPGSEQDADGEVDDDMPALVERAIGELATICEDPPQVHTRLESPLRLDGRESPISSPPTPPTTAEWLQSISSSTWSSLVPFLAPPHFGASLAPGLLRPPFVFQSTTNEAVIESPDPQEEPGQAHLISVADSLLNMHSTPITSPGKSSRKPVARVGVQLDFSPINPRSRSTSASWDLTLGPAHDTARVPPVPQSDTPTSTGIGVGVGATRPRPGRTRSMVQPPRARPSALGRSISFSTLDDPFAEPSLPVASSPAKGPISSSATSSPVQRKRIAVSFDMGSFAFSSESSASPEPPRPSRTPASGLSPEHYDSSPFVKARSFKTPLRREYLPPALRESAERNGWTLSSPANTDTANELGLAPDHYTSQTPGYLRWVQQTPASMRPKMKPAGGRGGSAAEDG